jgi:opacity protein-like surface antigen
MKKLLAVSLVGLAGAVAASDLDLQTGQWSVNLKPTNLSVSAGSSKSEYPDANTTDTSGSSNRTIILDGRYGFKDNVILGLYGRIYSFTSNDKSNVSDTITSTKRTDFDYTITPSIEYAINKNVALYGSLAYQFDDADLTTDQDGNENYSGNNNFTSFTVSGGVLYKKDIKSNLMIMSKLVAGWDKDYSEEEVDSSESWETQYRRVSFTNDAIYFLANNFSVDAGIGLYAGKRLNGKTNDVENDYGDDTWSYTNVGTRLGFTYYHR